LNKDFYEDLNQTDIPDSKGKLDVTKVIKIFYLLIVPIILGLYFFTFHGGLSQDNDKWGTFGDYVGGILNPIIAIGALYLIAKTYDLQKSELAETIKLLKVSTDSQDKQIKLAALTALLSSNLTRIGLLKSEKIELSKIVKSIDPKLKESILNTTKGSYQDGYNKGFCKPEEYNTIIRIGEIDSEINKMSEANIDLERQINSYIID
jgi:hypothetical protein